MQIWFEFLNQNPTNVLETLTNVSSVFEGWYFWLYVCLFSMSNAQTVLNVKNKQTKDNKIILILN